MSGVIFNQVLEVATPREVKSPYSTEVVLDWENPVWTMVGFEVSVQPGSTTEDAVERPLTVADLVLITPPGTDIPALKAESRVRVGGVMVLDVKGAPRRWPDPHRPGVVHHLEATLGDVSG